MWFHIYEKEGAVIFSNLPEIYRELPEKCEVETQEFIFGDHKVRHGRIESEDIVVYGITNKNEIVSRRRYFKEILKAHLTVLPTIRRVKKQESARSSVHVDRLIHNLESLNGNSIQELFDLIGEDELRNTPQEDKKSLIQNRVKERFETIHKTVLKLIKNNTAIKMEFSLFQNALMNKNPQLEKQFHPLRKALMNVVLNFSQDFYEKGVRLNVEEYEGNIFIDYGAFQSAFYQLFDNATKYTSTESDINISFINEGKYTKVIISMVSLQIKPDEVQKIKQEKFCGAQAKKSGLNGEGIGMFAICKALQQIRSQLEVEPRPNEASFNKNGLQYERNVFTVTLPNYKW